MILFIAVVSGQSSVVSREEVFTDRRLLTTALQIWMAREFDIRQFSFGTVERIILFLEMRIKWAIPLQFRKGLLSFEVQFQI